MSLSSRICWQSSGLSHGQTVALQAKSVDDRIRRNQDIFGTEVELNRMKSVKSDSKPTVWTAQCLKCHKHRPPVTSVRGMTGYKLHPVSKYKLKLLQTKPYLAYVKVAGMYVLLAKYILKSQLSS